MITSAYVKVSFTNLNPNFFHLYPIFPVSINNSKQNLFIKSKCDFSILKQSHYLSFRSSSYVVSNASLMAFN